MTNESVKSKPARRLPPFVIAFPVRFPGVAILRPQGALPSLAGKVAHAERVTDELIRSPVTALPG